MNVLLIGDPRNLPPLPAGSPLQFVPARTLMEIPQRLAAGHYEVAVVELDFGPTSSEALLMRLRKLAPEIPVIALVNRDEKPARLHGLRATGVRAFVVRPFEATELLSSLRRHGPGDPPSSRPASPAAAAALPELHSLDPQMHQVHDMVRRAAATNATILLTGESGTGKTLLARATHQLSERRERAFVTVSCPCLSRELLESELFGHVQGAFTGAVRDTWGKVSAADRGTLFLDEIGELPATLQPKLLRLLQEREYERVGETKVRPADVRIIAATNRDLKSAVEAGTFREDLYFRLNVISIDVPPLRARRADILPLAREFLAEIAEQNHRPTPQLTPSACALLERHSWPGNLRELHNLLERAAVLHDRPDLDASALADLATQPAAAAIRLGDQVSLRTVAEAHIREVIAHSPTLDHAAHILGTNKSTLYRKRQRMSRGVTPFPQNQQSIAG